ncbi:hypothetical protein ACIF9R_18900 [Streptomyces sp. NPDC086080]|uniref:hypothetical protein n=1 Tax=Streptomyces sp. NPDC086080 TaxID=3365748 RepID=UPI0037CD11B4
MRALPARRIACGALCAALLAGATGPAAMAADSAPGRDRAASSAELLTRAGTADAPRGDLAPVVDLVRAVLEADGGQLPPDRAARLGDAARAAVAEADDDDPATVISTTVTTTTATSSTSTFTTTPALVPPATTAQAITAPGVLLPAADTAADPTGDALDAVREALDGLLELLSMDDSAAADQKDDQETTAADDLNDRLDDLIEALTGADAEVSTLPAPAGATTPESTTPATLPALISLLLPTS